MTGRSMATMGCESETNVPAPSIRKPDPTLLPAVPPQSWLSVPVLQTPCPPLLPLTTLTAWRWDGAAWSQLASTVIVGFLGTIHVAVDGLGDLHITSTMLPDWQNATNEDWQVRYTRFATDGSVEGGWLSCGAQTTDVVGLSALLTTTMPVMARVVAALKESGQGDVKVIIGGAPVSESFAQEIGAQAYGFDAARAVELVRGWLP